jgi:D-glycero-alpha-D-manno-heptose 1-phosphate guanylyltransferase
MNIDVLILCGGQGNRLKKIVTDRPKPMAEINGHPFLDILINYIEGFGFKRFILSVCHMSDFIKNYYRDKVHSLEILFSLENEPLGTGGAVKNTEKLIYSDSFLVMNGDSFCPVNLTQFMDFHNQKNALLSMVVVESNNSEDFGQITLDNSQRIIQFEEKKRINGKPLINAGIYLFKRDILSMIPPNIKYSLEYDLFPKLVGKEFYGFVTEEKLLDIGTPERYEEAKRFFC